MAKKKAKRAKRRVYKTEMSDQHFILIVAGGTFLIVVIYLFLTI